MTRIQEIIGTEIADVALYFGPDGELNGRISGKEKSATITTITAGGYNIQCFHFRVLIRELK